MTDANAELAQWLKNGDMAKLNRAPGATAVPVVLHGKPVKRKPGKWQGSEHDLQTAVFQWAHDNEGSVPELAMMFAIPNGQYRRGMRMEPGLKPGVPDIFLSVARSGWHGLYIELKVGRNKPSEAQREWLHSLGEYGYKTAVCRDLESVQAVVMRYLNCEYINILRP